MGNLKYSQKNKCETRFCRNRKALNRKICSTCIKRKWRANNPKKASYENLRTNAKRRGKEFSLTFAQFEEFCVKYNYVSGGKTRDCYTIDRIENDKGYTIGNIQKMKRGDNSKKGTKTLQYLYTENGMDYWVTTLKKDDFSWDDVITTPTDNDNPFM